VYFSVLDKFTCLASWSHRRRIFQKPCGSLFQALCPKAQKTMQQWQLQPRRGCCGFCLSDDGESFRRLVQCAFSVLDEKHILKIYRFLLIFVIPPITGPFRVGARKLQSKGAAARPSPPPPRTPRIAESLQTLAECKLLQSLRKPAMVVSYSENICKLGARGRTQARASIRVTFGQILEFFPTSLLPLKDAG